MKSEDAAFDAPGAQQLEPAHEPPDVLASRRDAAGEAPLTGTLRFVFVMGATFFVLWLAMYALLRVRW